VPIGREDEYRALHSAITQFLQTGQGGVVHLSGCSGMGKTLTTTLALSAVSTSAAGSPGMSEFRVVWLNGAGVSGLGELVRAIAVEIGLDVTIFSVNELRAAVEKMIRTPTQRRGACVPLLVVVVDEVDLLNADAAAWLLLSAVSSSSSLLLVGMGNTPNLVRKFIGAGAGTSSLVTEINFTPYSAAQLNDILENVTCDLFARPARSFLASKVIVNNKRKTYLFGYFHLPITSSYSTRWCLPRRRCARAAAVRGAVRRQRGE
jgi:Cdc6-like AAA superfamily ATPase